MQPDVLQRKPPNTPLPRRFRRGWGALSVRLSAALRLLLNPVSLFIGLQTMSVTTIVLWVVWFSRQEDRFQKLAESTQWRNIESGTTVAILVVGCILLGGILVLTVVWFLDGLRQAAMIKQQRNFLSSVTHEVRSPLASIQLALETLERHGLSDEVRARLIKGAHEDISRLTRLVDQILIASRLDRGITLFNESPEPVDLTRWLPDISRQISESQCRSGTDRVVVDVEPGLTVFAPVEALRTIIENLLQNALKYSPDMSPVDVVAEKQGKKIIIRVKDRGMGLDANEVKQVFKIFRRGERVVSQAIPGTGLGLYIVATMTQLMGGRVRAESEGPDKGSVFCLELPANELDDAPLPGATKLVTT